VLTLRNAGHVYVAHAGTNLEILKRELVVFRAFLGGGDPEVRFERFASR
jgi:hypothetical protein